MPAADPTIHAPQATIRRPLCIYASQVAACIGANKYQRPRDALEAVWRRHDPAGFEAALRRNAVRTDDDVLRDLVRAHADVADLLSTPAAPQPHSTAVARAYRSAADALAATDGLAADERRLVDDALRRTLYAGYGAREESGVLDHVRAMGIPCVADPAFHKRQAGVTADGAPWFVGGRVDALSEDRTLLIEVKNRVNRLFRRLPPYEHVQVQTYLHVLDMEHGLLVECLKDDQGRAEINAVPVRRDRDMWDRDVAPKLQTFVDYLHAVVHDTDEQDRYMRGGPWPDLGGRRT